MKSFGQVKPTYRASVIVRDRLFLPTPFPPNSSQHIFCNEFNMQIRQKHPG